MSERPTFSRLTLFEAVDSFGFRTNASIEEFTLRFGIEECLPDSGGIEPKEVAIKRWLAEHQDAIGPLGGPLAFEVIEYLLEQRLGRPTWSYDDRDPEELFPRLVRALRLDGYEIEGTNLVRVVPSEVDLHEAESRLEALLTQYDFPVAAGHLRQAREAYARGSWASANSQLRSFIEDLFMVMAQKEGCTAVRDGSHAFQLLASLPQPMIASSLGEWDPNGKGFIQGFWKRLHSQGSHPGLSDDQDCAFRMQIVVIVSSHFLTLFASRH